jgi:hypothetical protein
MVAPIIAHSRPDQPKMPGWRGAFMVASSGPFWAKLTGPLWAKLTRDVGTWLCVRSAAQRRCATPAT